MIELRSALEDPNVSDVKLLWTDPPYGTGKKQVSGSASFDDPVNTGYVVEALMGWTEAMSRNGVICVCCDYRLAPSVIAGLSQLHWNYRGEVIWEFGLGRPRTNWWPVRHNSILTFSNRYGKPKFDHSAVPRAKRLALKEGYPDDKPAGSVWDFTMSNNNSQRVGYPNQKPLEIIRPFILAHTDPGDLVADPFCGSGSTGVAALEAGRRFYGCDTKQDAIDVTMERIANVRTDDR